MGLGQEDPELITVKGKRLLEEAQIIIYAGSLVNKDLLNNRRKDCKVYDSASMTLEEVITVMDEGAKQNYLGVRLHTGDLSIYGAIREQMDCLDEKN